MGRRAHHTSRCMSVCASCTYASCSRICLRDANEEVCHKRQCRGSMHSHADLLLRRRPCVLQKCDRFRSFSSIIVVVLCFVVSVLACRSQQFRVSWKLDWCGDSVKEQFRVDLCTCTVIGYVFLFSFSCPLYSLSCAEFIGNFARACFLHAALLFSCAFYDDNTTTSCTIDGIHLLLLLLRTLQTWRLIVVVDG